MTLPILPMAYGRPVVEVEAEHEKAASDAAFVIAECKPFADRTSVYKHSELRALTRDGRCPVCDSSVSRAEYGEVLARIARDPDLRRKVKR